MHLRKLRMEDAPLMLEWMHDKSIVRYLNTDFASKTLNDCKQFIWDSLNQSDDEHFAIADDKNDEYLGTVSLKNISFSLAEFAIVVRRSAVGKGVAAEAMKKIIDFGFEKYNLQYIYWYVSPQNRRALSFYDKNGYNRVDTMVINEIKEIKRVLSPPPRFTKLSLVCHKK